MCFIEKSKNQLPETVNKQTALSHVKDPYILEFLGIKPEDKSNDKGLENAIISHLERFLLEMGKGFSFVERQMHIKQKLRIFISI